jgi:hypothetical protein
MTEKYIPIYSANGINNAILIKNLLVSFNIPAETYQESAGISYGIVSGPLGQALVYVPANSVEDANAIIRAYENNEFASPDDPEETSEESN